MTTPRGGLRLALVLLLTSLLASGCALPQQRLSPEEIQAAEQPAEQPAAEAKPPEAKPEPIWSPSLNTRTSAPSMTPLTSNCSKDSSDALLRFVRSSSSETPLSVVATRSTSVGGDNVVSPKAKPSSVRPTSTVTV